MKFAELFMMGGWHFMLMVSLLGLSMVFFVVISYIKVYVKKQYDGKGVNYILMFGSMAFIIGLLGQSVGMFAAFDAIQRAGDISPVLIARGLRVSMIAPVYGLLYFIFSIPLWMIVREKIKRNN